MKQIIVITLAILLTCPYVAFSQDSPDNMALLSERMEELGGEMDGLGKVMEKYGAEMETYGQKLEKSSGHSPQAVKQMEELGEKMNQLGEEMGKLGEQMGQYGEKMGVLHQQMINWFFQELKKDALIPSLNRKVRIIFDEKGLNVDGNNASEEQFKKYKAGFEKYWGRTLKPDFLFFFKGTLQEKDGKIQTEGQQSTNF